MSTDDRITPGEKLWAGGELEAYLDDRSTGCVGITAINGCDVLWLAVSELEEIAVLARARVHKGARAHLPLTDPPPVAEGGSPVTVWKHSRKGIIRGELIRDDGTWLTIRLDGDHHLAYGSEANRGRVDEDGSLIVVRASLMTDA